MPVFFKIFSYLTNFVLIDSNVSNILYTQFGVPQGSILEPIFLTYA